MRKLASVVSIDLQKAVFGVCILKMSTDAESLTDWGRAFHSDAAATAKEPGSP